ncbi:MAG: hypothetical protein ACRECH_05320 [Nitrososphaerales archaeon]
MKIFHRKSNKGTSEVREINQKVDPLRELCGPDDGMYGALSQFLLLDPRHQVEQLGGFAKLWEEGSSAMQRGNKLQARVSFETAARIALYDQDRASLKKSLESAEQASENEINHRLHQTLLSNLDKALKITGAYYNRLFKPNLDDSREKTEKSLKPSIASVGK